MTWLDRIRIDHLWSDFTWGWLLIGRVLRKETFR